MPWGNGVGHLVANQPVMQTTFCADSECLLSFALSRQAHINLPGIQYKYDLSAVTFPTLYLHLLFAVFLRCTETSRYLAPYPIQSMLMRIPLPHDLCETVNGLFLRLRHRVK